MFYGYVNAGFLYLWGMETNMGLYPTGIWKRRLHVLLSITLNQDKYYWYNCSTGPLFFPLDIDSRWEKKKVKDIVLRHI